MNTTYLSNCSLTDSAARGDDAVARVGLAFRCFFEKNENG
jgi:hypothetical protein